MLPEFFRKIKEALRRKQHWETPQGKEEIFEFLSEFSRKRYVSIYRPIFHSDALKVEMWPMNDPGCHTPIRGGMVPPSLDFSKSLNEDSK